MAGKGFFAALRFLEDFGKAKDFIQKRAWSAVKTALDEKYQATYITIFGAAPYQNLDKAAGSDSAKAERLGLAMRELRLEVEERTKNLQTATSSKKAVVADIGKQALISGAKSVASDITKEIVLGSATGGVSLAVGAAKKMAPDLLKMAGHAVADKKEIVKHYLTKGADGSALVVAMSLALFGEAEGLDRQIRTTHTFDKPQKTAFWSKSTSLKHEEVKLQNAIGTYTELVTKVLNGETNNSDYVPLIGEGDSSDD